MPVAQSSSHGTKDMVVPYEGGASALHKSCDQCMLLSEGESNKRWAMHNGCDLDEGMVRPLLRPTPPPCAAVLPPCAAAKPNSRRASTRSTGPPSPLRCMSAR